MKHLKVFETNALFEAARTALDLPNVSLIEENFGIQFLPYVEQHDYSQDYLTFEAIEDTEFSFIFKGTSQYGGFYITSNMRESIAYSLDNGETWTELINPGNLANTGLTTPTIHQGEKVIWKGVGTSNFKGGPTNCYCYFSSTGKYNIEGNILSIACGDNFKNQILENTQQIFRSIFEYNTELINAQNLIILATDYASYMNTFRGCTSLITLPKLVATTLTEWCYDCMFEGCTSLTSLPSNLLPATTLADNCYGGMFRDCTGLITVPSNLLPATILTVECYSQMFENCTSLTAAPDLLAPILANSCYYEMFENCTSLNYIKCLATDISASYCIENWLTNVASLGAFVKNTSTTWTTGIPSGWTVEDAS